MSQKIRIPGWENLSLEEKELVKNWIKAILQAQATSTTLINYLNVTYVNDDELVTADTSLLDNKFDGEVSITFTKNFTKDLVDFPESVVLEKLLLVPSPVLILQELCKAKCRILELGSEARKTCVLDCESRYTEIPPAE